MAQRIDGHERILAVGGPVGLAHAIYQWYLGGLARQFGGHVTLVAEVVEVVVAYLPVGHLHGAVVDAVVHGVILGRGVLHAVLVDVVVDAVVADLHRVKRVGQVDDLAHLSLLEQRGVALAIYLLHLPAHGRQLQRVFARREVGRHHHAFALCQHRGVVLVAAARMAHHLLALRAVGVQVVIHQPRRVVAL